MSGPAVPFFLPLSSFLYLPGSGFIYVTFTIFLGHSFLFIVLELSTQLSFSIFRVMFLTFTIFLGHSFPLVLQHHSLSFYHSPFFCLCSSISPRLYFQIIYSHSFSHSIYSHVYVSHMFQVSRPFTPIVSPVVSVKVLIHGYHLDHIFILDFLLIYTEIWSIRQTFHPSPK